MIYIFCSVWLCFMTYQPLWVILCPVMFILIYTIYHLEAKWYVVSLYIYICIYHKWYIYSKVTCSLTKLVLYIYIYIYMYVCVCVCNRLIGPLGRVFTNGLGDRGSIPGRVIPKTLKMVLNTSLLNTQQYKVRIKGKVEQSEERSSALPYTSVVVAIEKGAFWSPILHNNLYVCI